MAATTGGGGLPPGRPPRPVYYRLVPGTGPGTGIPARYYYPQAASEPEFSEYQLRQRRRFYTEEERVEVRLRQRMYLRQRSQQRLRLAQTRLDYLRYQGQYRSIPDDVAISEILVDPEFNRLVAQLQVRHYQVNRIPVDQPTIRTLMTRANAASAPGNESYADTLVLLGRRLVDDTQDVGGSEPDWIEMVVIPTYRSNITGGLL